MQANDFPLHEFMEKIINQAIAAPATFTRFLDNLQKHDEHMTTFLQTITRYDFPLNEEHIVYILQIQFNDAVMERALVFYRKLMLQDSVRFLSLMFEGVFGLLTLGTQCYEFYSHVLDYLASNYGNFAHIMKKALRLHFTRLYQLLMSRTTQHLENSQHHFHFLFYNALRLNGFQVELLDEAMKLLIELDLHQSRSLEGHRSFYEDAELSEDAICGSLKAMSLQHLQIQADTEKLYPYEMSLIAYENKQDVEVIIMLVDQLLAQLIQYLQQLPDAFHVGSFFPIFFDKMMPVLPLQGDPLAPFLIFPFLTSEAHMLAIVSNLVKIAFAAPNTGIGAAVSACCYLCGILLHFNFERYDIFGYVVNVLANISAELSQGMPQQQQFALLRPEHQRAAIAAQTFIIVLNKAWYAVNLGQFEPLLAKMLENNVFAFTGKAGRDFWELIADVQCYPDEMEYAVMLYVERCQEHEIIFDTFRSPRFNVFSPHIANIWRSW